MNVDREELAWAAGFHDGEGSCVATRTKTGYSLRVTATQHEHPPRLLRRFAEALGAGNINGPYGDGTRYTFAINDFEHAQQAICLLWPWIGEVKKQQIESALALYHSTPHRRRVLRFESAPEGSECAYFKCTNVFVPSRSTRIYCSDNCRSKAYVKRQSEQRVFSP